MPTRTTPRGPWGPSGGGGPGGGGIRLPPMTPVPRDVLAILIVSFVTYTMGAFQSTALIPAVLHLGALWPLGVVWQVFTYPFAGAGGPSIWVLLGYLILYWFLRDAFYQLGRRRFWRDLLTVTVVAGIVAVVVELAALLLTGAPVGPAPFSILNGQWTLMAFAIAAFATLNRDATILFMFVLPIQARWFLWIEVAFAFVAFLDPEVRDLAGFVGILVVIWGTYALLTAGGPTRLLREWRLKAEKSRLERQLARERKKRNLRVLEGGGEREGNGPSRGPWVH